MTEATRQASALDDSELETVSGGATDGTGAQQTETVSDDGSSDAARIGKSCATGKHFPTVKITV